VSRHSAPARILWRDDKGKPVRTDPPPDAGPDKGYLPQAEPEPCAGYTTVASGRVSSFVCSEW